MDLGNLSGQVSQSLNMISFPAEKQEVIQQVQEKGAGDTIVSALEKIPDGVYSNANEVAEKLGASGA